MNGPFFGGLRRERGDMGLGFRVSGCQLRGCYYGL